MEQLPCKNTFDMTVHIVIAAVKERLEQGPLTAADLAEIEQGLTIENHQVEAFCHSVHERCMSKSKLDLIVPPRTNAYGRIMVQPLESLFDRKNRRFSEKQLSNYFQMLSQILGRKVFEGYHDQLSSLLRAEIRDHGSHFKWDTFYDHPDVVKIRVHTLGVIALAFSHYDQRLQWFIDIMESSVDHEDQIKGTQQFTEKQANAFLKALFGEFTNMGPTQKERFDTLLKKDQRSAVSKLLIKLEQTQ